MRIQQIILTTFSLCILNINIVLPQFNLSFKVNQYSNPNILIDVDKRIYVGVSSANDSIRININTYFPLGIKKLRRESEAYFEIFNANQEIIDTFHFYGITAVTITGTFVDESGNYYFALQGPDSLYQNKKLFVNPYINVARPVYIFHYNVSTKNLKLCKTLGNGYDITRLYANEDYLYVASNFGPTAYLDTFVIANLTQGTHELDILSFRINTLNEKVEKVYPILGAAFNYPMNIIADGNKNIYLSTDIYSKKLYYASDTIVLEDPVIGNSLFFKFSNDGNLEWYHKTKGLFYQALIFDGVSYVLGNYLNTLSIDSLTVSTLLNTEHGFISKFNSEGNYNRLISFDGIGDRRLNLIKPAPNFELIVAGTFEQNIDESPGNSKSCLGVQDSYVFIMDTNGYVKHSWYFQGDSLQYVEDLIVARDGHLLVLGYTWSDTLLTFKDTLKLNEHKKNYFIYEVKDSIINNSKSLIDKSFSYHICPNPFSEHITIEEQSDLKESVICKIINQNGIIVHNSIINSNKTKIPTTKWAPGLYYINLRDKDKIIHTIKAIKI